MADDSKAAEDIFGQQPGVDVEVRSPDELKHGENQPEVAFAAEMEQLMTLLKDRLPQEWEAVIILKPNGSENPAVYSQGHPFDVLALAASYVRQMKQNLMPEIDC